MNRLLNGALIAALVQFLMTKVLHTEGFGAELGGIQIEALIAGLLGLFADKIPAWLKPILNLFLKPTAVAADGEPTDDDAKTAAVVFGKRCAALCPHRLAEFRAVAIELGGASWGSVIPKPETPNEPVK